MIQRTRIGFRFFAATVIAATCLVVSTPTRSYAQGYTFAGHIATRGYNGSYTFACFANYPGYSNTLQITQGTMWVSLPITSADVLLPTFENGYWVYHVVKDAYLNGFPTMPVRVWLDLELVDGTYKIGTPRWLVTNRPGAATQRTWMDSSRIFGSLNGYLGSYFRMDLSQ
jgi:hypothetical protein